MMTTRSIQSGLPTSPAANDPKDDELCNICSPEAEASLLGALIIEPEQVMEVQNLIKVGDFQIPPNGIIYSAILGLHDEGRPIDIVFVVDELRTRGKLEMVGGAEYVASLVDQVPNPRAAMEYAKDVRTAGLRNRAIRMWHEMGVILRTGAPIDGKARMLQEALEAIQSVEAQNRGSLDEPRTLAELLDEEKTLGEVNMIPSSIHGLSALLGGGYAPSWFILFGGYTGSGKTSILLAEAIGAASKGHPVLFVSLELCAREIARKIKAALEPDGVPPELPLRVLDNAHELDDVIARVERWAKNLDGGKTPVVAIDYAQRIIVRGESSRERQVAQIAETLQALGRRESLLLLVGAQLNRESVKKGAGPALHQIRESGLLEQVADVVLLLEKRGPERSHIMVGKHRWGASGGELDLSADFAKARFGPLTPTQLYGPLSSSVLKYLEQKGGNAKVRDVQVNIRWEGRHPRKDELIAAAKAIGAFKVVGSEVIWMQ